MYVCSLNSLHTGKSKCDKILEGYTVGSSKEGHHDQLDCTPRHFDSQYVILAFRTMLQNSPAANFRDRRILLEKVADSARKAVKLAEPYKPYGGQFLEFCSIFYPHTKHA